MDQSEQLRFEDEVRQVARLLWSEAALSGSQELEGRERDGVFETRDALHVVEATVSAKKEKVADDAKKTSVSVQNARRSSPKFAQGWLITMNEPTVDQKREAEKYSATIRLMSFEQFRSLMFNGGEYVRCRYNHSFGSVADPITKSPRVDRRSYVSLELLPDKGQPAVSSSSLAVRMYTNAVRAVVVGDFGAGKSMTLRDIFFRLADRYRSAQTSRTPIYINLREHRGQSSPVECLERHLREIGYSGGVSDLVRAWRGGHADILLDGFDEIATTGWGQSLRRVREHRYAAMALVRNFAIQTPIAASVIVAGRSNFFDSRAELQKALGVNEDWAIISLNDFTEVQARAYLSKLGYKDRVPEWLPSRPLIVGYFALLGRGSGHFGSLVGLSAGAGWNAFLAQIAEREALQDERLDPSTVRQIIERLATKARNTADGLGRLGMDVIQEAYREIVGGLPDEGGQQLLHRLPGLAPSSAEDGTRSFVDPQFASAARAGDVCGFLREPYSRDASIFSESQASLGESGREVVLDNLSSGAITEGQLKAAVERLRLGKHPGQVTMDLVGALSNSGEGSLLDGLYISDATEESLSFTNIDLSRMTFDGCLVSGIELDENTERQKLPRFINCVVGTVDGLGAGESLPAQFRDSDVASLMISGSTTSDLMNLALVEPVKVLLTVLKKLYLQKGSGRQLSAFSRGLDSRSSRYVTSVLHLVEGEGLATPTRIRGHEIWVPDRAHSARVRQILAAPLLSRDPLLGKASVL